MKVYMGMIITSFFIYRIFMIERFPIFLNNVSIIRLAIIILLIVGYIITVKNLIHKIMNKQNISKLSQYLNAILYKYYIEPLKELAEYLLTYWIIKQFLTSVQLPFNILFGGRYQIIISFILFNILPQIYLFILLCWDIKYLYKLCLFYDHIFLFSIPLVFKAFLHLLETYNKQSLLLIEQTNINIRYNANNDEYHFSPKYNMSHNTFQDITEICDNHLKSLSVIKSFYNLLDHMLIQSLQLLISLLFLYTWICLLLFIILL